MVSTISLCKENSFATENDYFYRKFENNKIARNESDTQSEYDQQKYDF